MRKRFLMILMSLVLVVSNTFTKCNILTVRAEETSLEITDSSVTMTAAMAAELWLLLYSLAESAMIAGGVTTTIDDYTTADGVVDSFMLFNQSVAPDMNVFPDISCSFSDGSSINMGETVTLIDTYGKCISLTWLQAEMLMNYGTITLDPDAETDTSGTVVSPEDIIKVQKAMLQEQNEMIIYLQNKLQNGGSGGDNNNDEEPESVWGKIVSVVIAGGGLAALGAFVNALWNDEIEGVEIAKEDFVGLNFEGYQVDENNYYLFNGYFTGYYGDYYVEAFYDTTFPAASMPLIIYGQNLDSYCTEYYMFYTYDSVNNVSGEQFYGTYVWYENGEVYQSYSRKDSSFNYSAPVTYSCNIPIFSSMESAELYFSTGNSSGMLNAAPYDYSILADSSPAVLAPMADVKFSPNTMPLINTTLLTAAQSLTETGTDTATNTATYTDTLTQALQEVEIQTETDTSTGTGTQTGTDTETGGTTGTDTETEMPTGAAGAESYKRDLKMIFPFCIPFDFIHFLEALAAEPKAPCFQFPFVVPSLEIDMSVDIDLSFLDSVMEIFRLGELGCFILLLMGVTGKVIKW